MLINSSLLQFFSSHERLRLSRSTPDSTPSTSTHSRQSTAVSTANSSVASINPHVDGATSDCTATINDIRTEDDAIWFLNLPDKFRSHHYSTHEVRFLAFRCASIFEQAASTLRRARLRPGTHKDDVSRWCDDLTTTMAPQQSEIFSGEPFRWLEDEDDLDLRLALNNYSALVAESRELAVQQTSGKGRGRSYSLRRTMALTNNAIHRTTNLAQTSIRSRKPSFSNPFASSIPIVPSIDVVGNDAAHFENPEARKKLRMYLASPQKFDEAVEFGFPANRCPRHGRLLPAGDAPTLQLPTIRQQSFLDVDDDDDATSMIEDAEGTSVNESDSPLTPSDGESGRPIDASRPVLAELHPNRDRFPSHSAQKPSVTSTDFDGSSSAREMTLRMTLTRPDLREDENLLYGPMRRHKRTPTLNANIPVLSLNSPQAIAQVFEDMDSQVEESSFKRIWRRVRPSRTY